MRRVRRLTTAGLATLGLLAGGLVLASAPALAAVPTVVSQSVPSIAPYEVRLEATVNAGEEPAGQTTECHFEYGKTSVTENKVECEQGNALEGGEQGVSLNVTVPAPGTPLAPGTTYHYRVVVENTTGKAEGTDKPAEEEFTTLTLRKHWKVSNKASGRPSLASRRARLMTTGFLQRTGRAKVKAPGN